jgi:hypothetical protein
MRLPFVIKDRNIQANFDYLISKVVSGLSAGTKISELRTLNGATMAVGATVVALNQAGITNPGIIIVAIQAFTHNNWTWEPHPLLGGVVFNNAGVAQNVNISYYVIGT